MRLLLLALPTFAVLGSAARASEPPASEAPAVRAQGRCALTAQAPAHGADAARTAARTADCIACHARDAHAAGGSHPVGIPYEAAAAPAGATARRGMLRAAAEVVSRGVFLPEGRIECVTCHDPRSPWKNHLAIPPGAVARPAVDPRRLETYTRPSSTFAATAAGAEVTPTPLCLACHAFD
ncbi:hypothetical protein [Anaeromyxobacter oryzae]|uniref:Doubled CXXCH motif domain-containing protein n=1 Tax=Anaeromyxobacter oryzae TaxID=2918170 RepID=A0ABN6MWC3_9BACT|nr:hypothetical protein [Anaeromyxobacter oryzae]BDG05269.1 hypothetical protein AMOR_42650 [Anaeromyxobacter oryzae]